MVFIIHNLLFTFFLPTLDEEAPHVSCPKDIEVEGSDVKNTAVTWALPDASDNVAVYPTVLCDPPSGSSFEGGKSTVTCRATDTAQNTGTCTFQVEIMGKKGKFQNGGIFHIWRIIDEIFCFAHLRWYHNGWASNILSGRCRRSR